MGQRDVLVLQALQIAQHFRFTVAAIEERMGQECRLSLQGARYSDNSCSTSADLLVQRGDAEPRGLVTQQHLPKQFNVMRRRALIQAHADAVSLIHAQIDAGLRGAGQDCGATGGVGGDGQRVKEARIAAGQPPGLQAVRKNGREAVDALRDGAQALRAVVHRIQGGDVGQQHLRGADVAVGLLAADMLFASLQ